MKGNTLEEGPGAGMLNRIWGGEIERSAGGKGSTGMRNKTQAK